MRLHRNAKTTPKGRALLVQRVDWKAGRRKDRGGLRCEPADGRKWRARYRPAGAAGCSMHARRRTGFRIGRRGA